MARDICSSFLVACSEWVIPYLSGLVDTKLLFEASFEANTNGSFFVTSFGACLFDSSLCSV